MLNFFRSDKAIQLPKTTSATTTTPITATTTTWVLDVIGALGYTLVNTQPTATQEGAFYDNGAFTCYTRQRERERERENS